MVVYEDQQNRKKVDQVFFFGPHTQCNQYFKWSGAKINVLCFGWKMYLSFFFYYQTMFFCFWLLACYQGGIQKTMNSWWKGCNILVIYFCDRFWHVPFMTGGCVVSFYNRMINILVIYCYDRFWHVPFMTELLCCQLL